MTPPPKPFFEIQGTTLGAEELAARIEKNIREREASGVYARFDLKKIVPFDLLDASDESQFLQFYLKAIQRAWAVDINDFLIPKKPGLLGAAEWALKKALWKLLKFYTFRLFSQQREFNSQVSHTLAALHKDYSAKADAIQQQILALKEKAKKS